MSHKPGPGSWQRKHKAHIFFFHQKDFCLIRAKSFCLYNAIIVSLGQDEMELSLLIALEYINLSFSAPEDKISIRYPFPCWINNFSLNAIGFFTLSRFIFFSDRMGGSIRFYQKRKAKQTEKKCP